MNKIYTIEHDVENGKKVLFISGIHGNEMSSIYLARQLYQVLNQLSEIFFKDHNISKVSFVPCVNIEGTRNNERYAVYVGDDLNRDWLSETKMKRCDLEELIKEHDVIVDLHSSPKVSNMFYIDTHQKGFLDYIEFCNMTKCTYGVSSTLNDSIKMYASSIGKVAFTWEMSGMERIHMTEVHKAVSYFVDLFLVTISNFMKTHDFSKRISPSIYDIVTAKDMFASVEGLYIPSHEVEIDNCIRSHDKLYEVIQLNDYSVERTGIKSPYGGKIFEISDFSYHKFGSHLLSIQPTILTKELRTYEY